MLSNLVGGPSIVFTRHSERNISKIRNKTKLCKKNGGPSIYGHLIKRLDRLLEEIENSNLNLI